MPSARERRRIAVIGAGMGGLAAAIDLARRGAAVTLLERASTPGGKMRRVSVATSVSTADPRCSRCVGCSMACCAMQARGSRTCSNWCQWTSSPAMPGATAVDSICTPISSGPPLRLQNSRVRARPKGTVASACAAGRSTRRSSGPSSTGTDLHRSNSRDASGSGASMSCWACDRGNGCGRPSANSSGLTPAAAVRPLRDVLRLVAPQRAGDADARRPRRAGGSLARPGRHARSCARAGGRGRRHGAEMRYGAHVAEIIVTGGRAAGVVLTNGERIDAEASSSTAIAGRWPAVILARRSRRRCLSRGVRRARFQRSRGACRRRLADSLWSITTFSLPRTTRANSQRSSVVAASRKRRPSMSAPRTVSATEVIDRPERLLVLVNAPADGDVAPISTQALADIERRTFRPDVEVRPGGRARDWRGRDRSVGVRRVVSRHGRRAVRSRNARPFCDFLATGITQPRTGAVSCGRFGASRAGRAHGHAFGQARR